MSSQLQQKIQELTESIIELAEVATLIRHDAHELAEAAAVSFWQAQNPQLTIGRRTQHYDVGQRQFAMVECLNRRAARREAAMWQLVAELETARCELAAEVPETVQLDMFAA